jgi:hypothetical protein
VEHPRAVVLHLGLFEVEVFGLVVGQADRQGHAVVVLVGAAAAATRGPGTRRSSEPPWRSTRRQTCTTAQLIHKSGREN